MSKQTDPKYDSLLDDGTLGLIGSGQKPLDVAESRLMKLREQVMGRIDAEELAEHSGLITVRSYDGPWEKIAPLIEKKVLQFDENKGTESYLLRVEAGAEAPSHRHGQDELCIMLEGEIQYGDFTLRAGDYHFAPKGSVHGSAHSVQGALLFIHSGIDSQIPI